jgi:hypothetical protein
MCPHAPWAVDNLALDHITGSDWLGRGVGPMPPRCPAAYKRPRLALPIPLSLLPHPKVEQLCRRHQLLVSYRLTTQPFESVCPEDPHSRVILLPPILYIEYDHRDI